VHCATIDRSFNEAVEAKLLISSKQQTAFHQRQLNLIRKMQYQCSMEFFFYLKGWSTSLSLTHKNGSAEVDAMKSKNWQFWVDHLPSRVLKSMV